MAYKAVMAFATIVAGVCSGLWAKALPTCKLSSKQGTLRIDVKDVMECATIVATFVCSRVWAKALPTCKLSRKQGTLRIDAGPPP